MVNIPAALPEWSADLERYRVVSSSSPGDPMHFTLVFSLFIAPVSTPEGPADELVSWSARAGKTYNIAAGSSWPKFTNPWIGQSIQINEGTIRSKGHKTLERRDTMLNQDCIFTTLHQYVFAYWYIDIAIVQSTWMQYLLNTHILQCLFCIT